MGVRAGTGRSIARKLPANGQGNRAAKPGQDDRSGEHGGELRAIRIRLAVASLPQRETTVASGSSLVSIGSWEAVDD